MDITKKIIMMTVLISGSVSFSSDNRKHSEKKKKQEAVVQKEQDRDFGALWAGIAGAAVGFVAGTAIGNWLADLDEQSSYDVQYAIVYEVDPYVYESLSPKALEVKMRLDSLQKYGQCFDLSDNEQAVLSTLSKLGVRLQQIDANFYRDLEREYQTLSDAGYSIWWHSLKQLESQKKLYLNNCKNVLSFFHQHYDFIQACQIINSYNQVSVYGGDLSSWLYSQGHEYRQYPLLDYKEKVESDRRILGRLQRSHIYPALAQKIQSMMSMLDNLVRSLCRSDEYQYQVAQKRQDELTAEYNRIEEEKLEIARKQLKLQQEANRIAQERNRIEGNRFFKD